MTRHISRPTTQPQLQESEWRLIQLGVEADMLIASWHMIVNEMLDGKSADYVRGFIDGVRLREELIWGINEIFNQTGGEE